MLVTSPNAPASAADAVPDVGFGRGQTLPPRRVLYLNIPASAELDESEIETAEFESDPELYARLLARLSASGEVIAAEDVLRALADED